MKTFLYLCAKSRRATNKTNRKVMFPEQTGFSVTNLKYMKRWYSFYNERITNHQRLIDENRHQVGDELAEQNQDELMANWERLGKAETPLKISPLQ